MTLWNRQGVYRTRVEVRKLTLAERVLVAVLGLVLDCGEAVLAPALRLHYHLTKWTLITEQRRGRQWVEVERS